MPKVAAIHDMISLLLENILNRIRQSKSLDPLLANRRLACGGFTLIEVMVVVGIVGILVAIAVPAFVAYRERAKMAVCISGIKVIEKAVISHAIENISYPNTLAEVGLDGMSDPWNNPFQYLNIDGLGKKATGKARKDHFMVPINTDFDLFSMGPDGKSVSPLVAPASQDDIIRANDGQYVGRASRY